MQSDSPLFTGFRPLDYAFERSLGAPGHLICGIDEVGRGPLAGPVLAVAVILDEQRIPEGLDDSKALTARRREALHDALTGCCDWSAGVASVEEIDRINILQATMLAMSRAVDGLKTAPALALVDGNRAPALRCPAKPIVKGDGRVLSIAAASIIAKVIRDRLMTELALEHPGYGWERNAGYGTAEHLDALKRLGATAHHRKSFAPIRNILSPGGAKRLDVV
ncbi:MAG: ribonuclease HII [Parvibaculaceae bacterium]|nr:ribonuclease HII [Parvibaculaceae bacterium]